MSTNPHHDPRPWQDCTRADIREGDLVETLIRGLVRFGVAHRQDGGGDWRTKDGMVLTNGDRWPLRRVPAHTTEKEIPMPENTTPAEPVNSQAVAPGPRERITNEIAEWLEIETRKGGYSYLHMGCGHTMNLDPETRAALVASLAGVETTPAADEPLARTLLGVPAGHGAPHHDAGKIKFDDIVLQVDKDGYLCGGIAHHQDRDGNWCTENDHPITWDARRADRPDALTVWPAPTPPAEEVQMPGKPRLLTNVMLSGGEKIAEATWTGTVLLYARHPLATSLAVAPADQIEQWTLDGTRARRDGDRFIKVQEDEK